LETSTVLAIVLGTLGLVVAFLGFIRDLFDIKLDWLTFRERLRRNDRGLLLGVVLVLLAICTLLLTSTARKPGEGHLTEPTETVAVTISQCDNPIIHGFGKVWFENEKVRAELGCPSPPTLAEKATTGRYQYFEQGSMLWMQDDADQTHDVTYVIFADDKTFQRFTESFLPLGIVPGWKFQPDEKFDGIYRRVTGLEVEQRLGLPTANAFDTDMTYQSFERGHMLWVANTDDILVFYDTRSNNKPIRQWTEFKNVLWQ
jgi:hypothetical protein